MRDFVHLSYSDLVELFVWMHRIPEEGVGAFKARLRKLQAEEIPAGSRPGKGKRVDYSLAMITELAIALELIQAGLSPSDAADIIRANRRSIYSACLIGIASKLDDSSDPFILISPASMTGFPAEVDGRSFALIGAVSFFTRLAFVELFARRTHFEPTSGDSWRWLIIDVRKTMYVVVAGLTRDEDQRELVFDQIFIEWERDAPHRAAFTAHRLNKPAEIEFREETANGIDPQT